MGRVRLGAVALAATSLVVLLVSSWQRRARPTDQSPRAGAVSASLGVSAPTSAQPSAERSQSERCAGAGNVPDHVSSPCVSPEPKAHCKEGFCTIAPGCFYMGAGWCEWGRPLHGTDPVQVTLTRPFLLGEREVTQAEWTALGLPNPSGDQSDGSGDCSAPSCPVGNLTWFDALEFSNRKSRRAGLPECYVLEKCQGTPGLGMVCDAVRSSNSSIYDCRGYRLPTGAEWEYAARAGTAGSVYTGTVKEGAAPYSCYHEPLLAEIAWYCDNAGSHTHPGGGKKPNTWGLYDVIGNAGEWTSGLAQPSYGDGPYVDPDARLSATELLAAKSEQQVTWRGGTWNMWPNTLRAAMIAREPVSSRGPGLGLRLARSL